MYYFYNGFIFENVFTVLLSVEFNKVEQILSCEKNIKHGEIK